MAHQIVKYQPYCHRNPECTENPHEFAAVEKGSEALCRLTNGICIVISIYDLGNSAGNRHGT